MSVRPISVSLASPPPWRTYVTAGLAALVVLAGRPARTADLPAAPIPDGELEQMRGGYFSADGMQFSFGALMTTTVNGQLAFQTQVTFTPAGPQVTQTTGPNVAQAAGNITNGAINGLNLQGFTPDEIKTMNNGATALIQKVTGGTVENIVLNTASNQNIQQSTQLQLNLPGFAQTGQLLQQNLAIMHLMQSGQAGLAGVR